MKIHTVILSKPGRTATCLIRYREASWPDEVTWAGDREDFRLSNGNLVSLLASMDHFRETVFHQARQAGATVQMSDDGGDVNIRADYLNGSGEKVANNFGILRQLFRREFSLNASIRD